MARGKPARAIVIPSAPNPKPAQRAHRPNELGPRVYFRGRWAAADLRPWGGTRCSLRDPSARGWPERGPRTDDAEVAERWKWQYVDHLRDGAKRKQLGLTPAIRPALRLLGDAADEFIAHRLRTRAERTASSDGTGVNVHLCGTLGGTRRVDDIAAADLQRIANDLLDAGYQHTTVERTVAAWRVFFAWLGFADADNPAASIELPAVDREDVRAFTDEELVLLRRAADRLDRRERTTLRRVLELGLGTGGRQKELLALDWSAFRYADRTVRFTRQLEQDQTGLRPLKGKSARTTLVLPSWWRFYDARARGPVLTWNRQDRPLHTSYDQIKLLYATAGFDEPGLAFHALRHTYARLFLEMGGRLEELQQSLGHKSIRTTEMYYVHFSPERAAALARSRIYAGRRA